MQTSDSSWILGRLLAIREQIEPHFRRDTAHQGADGHSASSGHCAVTAIIAQKLLGGELVSAFVCGEEHWFNRINSNGLTLDCDLTGDQFDRPAVQVAPAGRLYSLAWTRTAGEIAGETLERAEILALRSGLTKIAASVRSARLAGDSESLWFERAQA